MEKLAEYFNDKPVRTVLDVGTGTGDFIAVLKESLSEAKITGIDPNVKSMEEAAQKYPEVLFKEMGGEKLLFVDNSFDVVSISMALHHLPNISRTLAEMQRVLKPGGWIVVNELFSDNLNPAQEVHKQYHHFRSTIDKLKGISHNPTFKKHEIIDLVAKSGVEISLQFEFKKDGNLITSSEILDERIDKMKAMLEEIKGLPEYDILKPQIAEFSEKAKQFGFESATRVVVVGTSK